MSFNIDTVEKVSGSLRISQKNAKKAAKLTLPEGIELDSLVFGEDGFAPVDLNWIGEGSDRSYDSDFRKFVKLLDGDAEFILTWEGGESHSGVRIRSGKVTEPEVIMALAPEE